MKTFKYCFASELLKNNLVSSDDYNLYIDFVKNGESGYTYSINDGSLSYVQEIIFQDSNDLFIDFLQEQIQEEENDKIKKEKEYLISVIKNIDFIMKKKKILIFFL